MCNRRALLAVVTYGTLGKTDTYMGERFAETLCLPPRSTRWIAAPKRVSLVTRAAYQQFQVYGQAFPSNTSDDPNPIFPRLTGHRWLNSMLTADILSCAGLAPVLTHVTEEREYTDA